MSAKKPKEPSLGGLSSHQLAERRRALRGRLEAQRKTIGAAWFGFEAAEASGEDKARRAIVWSRRLAGLAILAGAVRALKRPAARPGVMGRTMGTLAVLQKFGKLLRLTGWMPVGIRSTSTSRRTGWLS